MSNATRRFTRLLVLALVAASLSGCCFCGHYGYHGHGCGYWGPLLRACPSLPLKRVANLRGGTARRAASQP
jgi:ribosomal protein L32